jgi:hypothetical protein
MVLPSPPAVGLAAVAPVGCSLGSFPQWAGLPITLVPSHGTDHHIYRLGDQLAARLPRIGWATDQAAKEAEWDTRGGRFSAGFERGCRGLEGAGSVDPQHDRRLAAGVAELV